MTDHTIIQPGAQKRIGKYLVDGILGEGAMGVVYAGHDPDIDRQVAIKTVHKHLIDASADGDWLERFAREARAAGRVLHPNLVTIFEYLQEEGVPYLVMERIRSITLEDRLVSPDGLDLQEVMTIASQILDGLDCIHAAGIVHRDLKPANVMLTESGAIKLTDFGIARITAMDKTGAGMIGTPAYMAPEQFSGGDVDARADIYAMGVLLYELITGQKPFKGGGIEALIIAFQSGDVTPPSALVPGIPQALDDVILKAMNPDAVQRFASAAEMQAALAEASGHEAAAIRLPTASREASDLARSASNTMLRQMSSETMAQVEHNLVTKIGPMGQVIARRAAASAKNTEELLELVLKEVTQVDERNDLRDSIMRLLASNIGPVSAGVQDRDLQQLIALLKPYLGPITTILVKRQAAKSASVQDLIRDLSENIKNQTEKTEFVEAARQLHGSATDNATED
ncbi:serine/threonine-protein kinase [Cognatiyoonia sp. IB215446]|uniref:serine/threonine-protein kinase n=1 Tax=Cognatiyoonia sp. IB215446 TaxID=3097355 RepID=UPI002A0B506E|nr:serine/threonine-protein kinase [Cognatiyoonia sp. IB215446]MDX8346888.1 serine/threonine-protein kinase [Cognatiyoonia sp. IB215446]